MNVKPDPDVVDTDTAQLVRDIEQGLSEAKAGNHAHTMTPEQIATRRRNWPFGIDQDVVE